MTEVHNAELDSRILRILDQTCGGRSTAANLARSLNVRRDRLADRLRALKKEGMVEYDHNAWQRVRRAA